MKILITGGAGYIGSHLALFCQDLGCDVTIIDRLNLSVHMNDFFKGQFIKDDVRGSLTEYTLKNNKYDIVFHLASDIVVPESISMPFKYYNNNVGASMSFIEKCVNFGSRNIVFASTAAVYGEPNKIPISEDETLNPINPYGASKMMVERFLDDSEKAGLLSYAVLRFFNVAGADPVGRIGQEGEKATHLIKIASQVAIGLRDQLTICGSDYPTEDGTAVRDYIHIWDLARALYLSGKHILNTNESFIANCGYGKGFSVKEVVDAFNIVLDNQLSVVWGDRRPGDPSVLVSDPQKIKNKINWVPENDDLISIVNSAYLWEKKLNI